MTNSDEGQIIEVDRESSEKTVVNDEVDPPIVVENQKSSRVYLLWQLCGYKLNEELRGCPFCDYKTMLSYSV